MQDCQSLSFLGPTFKLYPGSDHVSSLAPLPNRTSCHHILDYCNPFWIVVLPLFLCPYSLLSPQGQSGLEKAIPDASHITQDGSQSPQSDLMPCHILASFTATYLFCCLHSSHRLLQWAMQASSSSGPLKHTVFFTWDALFPDICLHVCLPPLWHY